MVRVRTSSTKVDPELLRQSLWTLCSLSRAPLTPPCASDALGRLYNKDALLTHLLDRHSSPSSTPIPIPHIRGLKDIVELKLTPNTLAEAVFPFQCPLSGKQMDGKQRFVYLRTCGCAMSATGLRTTITTSEALCPVCSTPFDGEWLGKGKEKVGGDVVTINPGKEEEAEMREVMERTRAEERDRKKKSKVRTAEEAEGKKGKGEEEEKERKRRKAEKKAERGAKVAALTAELAAEKA